jgi:hypothetical protein
MENGTFISLCFLLEMHASFSSQNYKAVYLFRCGNIGLECIISKSQGQKKYDRTNNKISSLIKSKLFPIILSI